MHCFNPEELNDLEQYASARTRWALDRVVHLSYTEYANFDVPQDSPFSWRVIIQDSKHLNIENISGRVVTIHRRTASSVTTYSELLLPDPVYKMVVPNKLYIPNPPKLSPRILQVVAYLRRRHGSLPRQHE